MKLGLTIAILIATLGGCVVVPYDGGHRDDGYHRGERHGDGYYQGDGNVRGDGYYRGNRHYPNGAFSEHGK
jgi:hypothetical protein